MSRLVSSWENTPRDELELAHAALHDLVDEDELSRDQVRRAQEKIGPWLNGGRLEDTAGFLAQSGSGTTRRMAGPALADAVAALVVGDMLAREDAEILYSPWFNLIGAPPLPENASDSAAKAASKGAKAAPKGPKAAPKASKAAPKASRASKG